MPPVAPSKATPPPAATVPAAPELEIHQYTWREIWARFWPLARPHRWRWFMAALLVSAVGLAVAVVPLFPKYVIDHAIPERNIHLAFAAAGCFVASQFARIAMWYKAMRLVFSVQQEIVYELRRQGFSHLQKLCLRFHNQHPSGFLYERVFGNSINTLGGFMQIIFQQLTVYISGLLFSLGFCLWLDPLLTLIIVAGTVGYVIAARRMSRQIYRKTKASNEAGMKVTEIIMDKLRGTKTIQAYAMEDRVQLEFEQQLRPMMMRWLEAVLESTKLGLVTEMLGYVITASVVVGGAAVVIYQGRPLGTLVAFMGYQGTLIAMIQTLTNVYGQFASARSAFDQLFSVLDTQSTVADKPGAVMPPTIAGQLEFRHLSFAYRDKRVIKDLSLVIPAGESVALVGRSGSGKTTVANLLMRFYDPDEGSLLLDGHDLRDLPLRDYRALYGVVLQDPYLFDTTIAANLRYIRPEATDDELIAILQQARAWNFVKEFPQGLYHRVGEGGAQLSGGQRQRLAIARCLLVRSKFVILDEATSALDTETETLVQQAFDALFASRTVFIIAHRLSTIRRVNRIIVLDDGKLIEHGTYDELLASGGMFSYLHRLATSTSTHHLKIEEAGFA